MSIPNNNIHTGLYSSVISTSLSRVTKMRYYHSNYHLIGITLIPSDSNEVVLYALDIFDVLTHGEFYLGYLIHKALKSGLWHAWCQCISSNRLKIWKRVTYIPRSNVNTIRILVETYPVYTGIKIALFRCTFMGKCISSWLTIYVKDGIGY